MGNKKKKRMIRTMKVMFLKKFTKQTISLVGSFTVVLMYYYCVEYNLSIDNSRLNIYI